MCFQGERKLQGEIGENFAKVQKEPGAGWSLQQPGPRYNGGTQWRRPSSGGSGCVDTQEGGNSNTQTSSPGRILKGSTEEALTLEHVRTHSLFSF